jgi:arylsulfatase A-like enzyme
VVAIAAIVALAVAQASGNHPAKAAPAPPRPNVVVVMTDDQDARSVRVMESVRRHLVRGGTTFERSFATFPLCCPSRASFLTGQYAHNHGVMSNGGPNGGFQAFDPRGALPVSLRRAGYRTGYIGKYLNHYHEETVPPGWTEWHALTRAAAFNFELNDNGRIHQYSGEYQTDVLARKATAFIRSSVPRLRPFFLTLATHAPHSHGQHPPHPAPRHRGSFSDVGLPRPPSFDEADVADKPSFVQRQPRLDAETQLRLERLHEGRLASLMAVDEAVERIVGELRKAGELDDTLIVFTSDNGYLLGEHRLVKKKQLYDESARVPLILRGPAIPEGVERPQVTGNIDLAPTILDAAGAEANLVMDGVSLLPLALDQSARRNREILLENGASAAVRTPRYMYAEHSEGERELYDLLTDPFQLTSVHGDPSRDGLQADLARRLERLRSCAGVECR